MIFECKGEQFSNLQMDERLLVYVTYLVDAIMLFIYLMAFGS